MTKRRLHSWAAYSGLMAGFFYYMAMIAAGGMIYGQNPPLDIYISMFCHSSIYFCGFVTIGTEVCSAKDAPKLTLGVAWVAVRAALLRPIAAEDGSFPYARLLVWQDGYREETVRTENLKARLRRCPFPFMLFSGYREAPALMAQYAGHAAVQTVIFQTQEECEDWLLEDRRLETVYVGEIRTAAGRSDICVLFFSLRESPGDDLRVSDARLHSGKPVRRDAPASALCGSGRPYVPARFCGARR